MSHKRNEALRHVQHSMHHVIAAGEGSDRAPDSCKLCPYYRPDFKFRTCPYAHCPYPHPCAAISFCDEFRLKDRTCA